MILQLPGDPYAPDLTRFVGDIKNAQGAVGLHTGGAQRTAVAIKRTRSKCIPFVHTPNKSKNYNNWVYENKKQQKKLTLSPILPYFVPFITATKY